MNIFRLHDDPTICAHYHADRHCVKMIVEYAQLLSTAHHLSGSSLGAAKLDLLYRPTHANHPSAIWVRESKQNYMWLHSLLEQLCSEYTHRYKRVHKVEASGLLGILSKVPKLPAVPSTPLRLAMPDEFKQANAVAAYRHLYAEGKSHLLVWTGRDIPPFLKEFGYHQENCK